MKKSHLIFCLFCIAWVLGLTSISYELVEQEGLYPTLGKSIVTLIIPTIGYATYIFIQNRRLKKSEILR